MILIRARGRASQSCAVSPIARRQGQLSSPYKIHHCRGALDDLCETSLVSGNIHAGFGLEDLGSQVLELGVDSGRVSGREEHCIGGGRGDQCLGNVGGSRNTSEIRKERVRRMRQVREERRGKEGRIQEAGADDDGLILRRGARAC